MKHFFLPFLATTLLGSGLTAQIRQDKADYLPPAKNEFWETLKKEVDSFRQEGQARTEHKTLQMRFEGIDVPTSLSEFKTVEAEQPGSQGITGTCWAYSTTSFYEAEVYRRQHKKVQLSRQFTVYWQYVEKAREYIKTRGNSVFDEGSETNSVQEMMARYGSVTAADYSGMMSGQPFQDHSRMVREMKSYLGSIKAQNAWNEATVLATIRSIMDHYMGPPPPRITEDGHNYTPQEYVKDVLKLQPDDYVTLMSLKSEPYWEKAEYKVADNWWHSTNYYNVPLDVFMDAIKSAIRNGYSISIGGDVSESGRDSRSGIMMIPSYDIPSAYINEDARLLRFLNGATTDDHAMHLIGYAERSNGTWFLIKDSGSGGFNNRNAPGYWFVHEDYIKLKMMTATMHKDAVKSILEQFK